MACSEYCVGKPVRAPTLSFMYSLRTVKNVFRAILNMVLYAILGIDARAGRVAAPLFRLPNGSISRFRFFPRARRWQADVIGDRSHWNGNE